MVSIKIPRQMPGMQPTLAWPAPLLLVVGGHAHSILEQCLRQPYFGGQLGLCSHPLWMDTAPVPPLLWLPPQSCQADRHCLPLLPPQEPGWCCTSHPQQHGGRKAAAQDVGALAQKCAWCQVRGRCRSPHSALDRIASAVFGVGGGHVQEGISGLL